MEEEEEKEERRRVNWMAVEEMEERGVG